MQEVGGSSPPISTDWVRLSVFSACGNLWLLHAFFCFGCFRGHSGFYFLECIEGVQLSFYCPSLQSSFPGSSLDVGIFFVGGRGATHQFFRCGVGCASVRLMREAWGTPGAFCGMPGAHCACF